MAVVVVGCCCCWLLLLLLSVVLNHVRVAWRTCVCLFNNLVVHLWHLLIGKSSKRNPNHGIAQRPGQVVALPVPTHNVNRPCWCLQPLPHSPDLFLFVFVALGRQISMLERRELISEEEVQELCKKASELLTEEPNICSVSTPVTVSPVQPPPPF